MPAGLIAYYDTSGEASQGDFIVTAGLVASRDIWLRVSAEWQDMLNRFRLPYIHMRELAPNHPPFERFREDPPGKVKLIEAICEIAHKGPGKAILSVVGVQAFNFWNDRFRLAETFGGPFAFCAAGCVVRAREAYLQVQPECQISHFHEKGEVDLSHTRATLLRTDGVELQSQPSRDEGNEAWEPAFQIADFVAWEFRRALQDAGRGKSLRRSFEYLRELVDLRAHIFDQASLMLFCLGRPDLYRDT